ncbi:hypothetical protein RHECNPAF_1360093 [Rhizobium etli CNPAF512]|nr:hypothetical protein RHECNPAF_1360093 [Rhizobium etli CNPAF512]
MTCWMWSCCSADRWVLPREWDRLWLLATGCASASIS